MCKRCSFLALSALLLSMIAGCNEPKLVSVEGRITVGDKALAKGSVELHPDADKGNTHVFSAPPVGMVKDGTYSISVQGKPGAPAGWYKVTVQANVPSDSRDEYSLPVSLINKDYTAPATSTLVIEVKEGAAPGTYDLKLKN